jgi:hypothetical protein
MRIIWEVILNKFLLPAALASAEKIISNQAEYHGITDPWGRPLRKYSFGQFDIFTPAGNSI